MKRLKLLCGALLGVLLVYACEAPAGTKKPDSNPDGGTTVEYPRIVSVVADEAVFFYDEKIPLENFSVFYQEEQGADETRIEPSKGEGEGFLINGKYNDVKAGIAKEGETGKYGWQEINFSLEGSPKTSFKFNVFVVAKIVDSTKAGDFSKLEVIREPGLMVYDKGEDFNPQGMVLIAWYGGTEAGATINDGGTPLHITQYDTDQSALVNATAPGTPILITLSYTDDRSTTKSTDLQVTMMIKQHELRLEDKSGIITFDAGGRTAATGAYVTLGITLNDDYALEQGGLIIETLDKDGHLIGPYTGIINELAPETFTRKVAFTMPRNTVKISGKVLQNKSGLGGLEYKVGAGAYQTVPGFDKDNHHLSNQLVVLSTVADGDDANKLYIQASPRDDMPAGSQVTIQIKQGSANLGDSAVSTGGPSGTLVNAEAEIAALTAGANHKFQIDVGYQASSTAAGVVRTYELQIMKAGAGTGGEEISIIYDFNGSSPDFVGSYQVFTAPIAGWYKFEAWGANGGNAFSKFGGKGGYVSGEIKLNPDGELNERMPLYIYVGGKGGGKEGTVENYVPGPGGWNGGGRGGESISRGGAGGGGASSVSTVAGEWNSIPVLANRILVAGGGGGASANGRTHTHTTEEAPGVDGSPGGGISGSSARTVTGIKYGAYTALTTGGTLWPYPDTFAPAQKVPPTGDPTAGVNGQGFGIGGYGREGDSPDIYFGDGYNGKGGGGGGWWGGRISLYRGKDDKAREAGAGGGGGSNYISGYPGCYGVEQVSVDGNGGMVVMSKGNSSYEGVGTAPSHPMNGNNTSPDIGLVEFKNGLMNPHISTPGADYDYYEPNTNDGIGIFNPYTDGNGRVKITYLGPIE